MGSKNKQNNDASLSILIREITTFPPFILRHLKFKSIENGQITMPQISVVLTLYEHNDGLCMSDLSRLMSSSMPVMTGIVSRLVEKGIVKRGNEPMDRRVVTVKLTKKGKKISREIQEMIESFWSSVIVKLDKNEQHDFIRIVQKIKRILQGEV